MSHWYLPPGKKGEKNKVHTNIPKVLSRAMAENLLGEKLQKIESYRVTSQGRDLFIEYHPAKPMLNAHWLILFKDSKNLMILDE